MCGRFDKPLNLSDSLNFNTLCNNHCVSSLNQKIKQNGRQWRTSFRVGLLPVCRINAHYCDNNRKSSSWIYISGQPYMYCLCISLVYNDECSVWLRLFRGIRVVAHKFRVLLFPGGTLFVHCDAKPDSPEESWQSHDQVLVTSITY